MATNNLPFHSVITHNGTQWENGDGRKVFGIEQEHPQRTGFYSPLYPLYTSLAFVFMHGTVKRIRLSVFNPQGVVIFDRVFLKSERLAMPKEQRQALWRIKVKEDHLQAHKQILNLFAPSFYRLNALTAGLDVNWLNQKP